MHTRSLDDWTHQHVYLGRQHGRNERRTWIVVALTAVMMVVEIVGGTIFGSMALVADGWHMATHAAALGISGLAYLFARRYVHDVRFSFGTGKLGDLAAFTSAVVLLLIALLIAYESVLRIVSPVAIAYGQAALIAVLGLVVNLASAWLLGDDHHHDHHGPEHDHDHAGHDDLNLRAAYIHVVTDALTSVLAIAGLGAAWAFGWRWVDPAVGLVGAAVISIWALGLMRDAGRVLLDVIPDRRLLEEIRGRLEQGGDRVCDLHVWQLGPGHHAAMVSIVAERPQAPSVYKQRLSDVPGLSHVTVEVEGCPDHVNPSGQHA
jgi:cation diffusion facilitator family transporter